MRSTRMIALAALPGLAVALASVLGWSPASRDLPTYFAPMRQYTAAVLRGEHGVFWNGASGCGEPTFANPQSALLYPPAWLSLALEPRRAIGVEAGLHLGLLAAGCALLATALGAGRWSSLAAGWGAALSGPAIDAVGVLNNLDTLAWLPWLWWATLTRRWRVVPLLVAAAALAGEPVLTLLGVAVAVTLAPKGRTVAALLLGGALVAVQLLPFGAWVVGGDRGPSSAEEVRGAVRAADAVGIAVPGLADRAPPDAFVRHTTAPLWALLLSCATLADGRGARRRLAAWGWVAVLVAVAAGLPLGGELWTAATLGLVRYPGRLLFLTVVLVLPVAAAEIADRRARRALAAAVALGAAGLGWIVGGARTAVAVQALAAGLVVGTPWAIPGALIGSLALAPVHLPALELAARAALSPPPCLEAQSGPGRVYAVAPSVEQLAWVAAGGVERSVALALGTTALVGGRRTVRSHAPLSPAPLSRHLAEADRGPAGRWWLDSLAATKIVAQRPIAGFPVLCNEDGLWVMDNPSAWPEVAVVERLPGPGERLREAGTVTAVAGADDWHRWEVTAAAGGGTLQWLATPDPGWRWRIDGRPATPLRGAGIIHGARVEEGRHVVEVRYRPPGLVIGVLVSVVGIALLGVTWRRW